MAERRRRRHSSVSESELSDEENVSTVDTPPRKPRDSECESEVGTEEVSEYESYQEGEEYETEEETEETEYEEESLVIEEESEGWIEEERQSGDGQEQPDGSHENLDDDEDAKNPAYIPRKGAFYEHDTRITDEQLEPEQQQETDKKEKKLWKDEGKWLHDKFHMDMQAPKTREELIAMYGFDIREAEGPPQGPRFSRQTRGKRGTRQLRDFMDGRQEFEGRREYKTSPRNNRDGPREYRDRPRDGPREYRENRDYERNNRGPSGPRDGPRSRGKPRRGGSHYGSAEIIVIEDRRSEEEKRDEEGYGRDYSREFSRGSSRGRGQRGGQRGGTGRVGPPQRKNYSEMRRNQRSASPPFSRPSPPPQPKITSPPQPKPEPNQEKPPRSLPQDDDRDNRETTPTNTRPEPVQVEKKSYQRDRRTNVRDKAGPPRSMDQDAGHGNGDAEVVHRQSASQHQQRPQNINQNNQGGGQTGKPAYTPANIPPRLQNQAYNQGAKGSASVPDLGQNRPKRYSSLRQRPANEGVAMENMSVANQMQRHPAPYYPGGGSDSEGIKFSANAPVFKPRSQPVYGAMPVSEPQAPRPPRMPGGVTSPPHTITTFPPQTSFPPQQAPFSIPPTSVIQSPPRMYNPTVTAAIPATGVTMVTAGNIMQPATYITAPPMSYTGGPPPPHPPPPHGPMAGPPPPPHTFQLPPGQLPPGQIPPGPHVPIPQGFAPTSQPNEVGVRIKGGTTYFNPELQQQHSPSRSPIRRPKAAIPIVNPQDLEKQEEEEYLQVTDSQSQELHGEAGNQDEVYIDQNQEYYEYQDYDESSNQSQENVEFDSGNEQDEESKGETTLGESNVDSGHEQANDSVAHSKTEIQDSKLEESVKSNVIIKTEEVEEFSEAVEDIKPEADPNTLSPQRGSRSDGGSSAHSDDEFHDTQELPDEAVAVTSDVANAGATVTADVMVLGECSVKSEETSVTQKETPITGKTSVTLGASPVTVRSSDLAEKSPVTSDTPVTTLETPVIVKTSPVLAEKSSVASVEKPVPSAETIVTPVARPTRDDASQETPVTDNILDSNATSSDPSDKP